MPSLPAKVNRAIMEKVVYSEIELSLSNTNPYLNIYR
jgi:hypothetical protein